MSFIFHLYTCNNLTDLAACYASHRQHSPNSFMANDLFTPEQVVVPTKGMAVWLEQFLARQGQIVVNTQFPYIRDQVNSILKHHFQSDRSFRPELFTPAVMTWRILAFLQQNLDLFSELTPYLQPERDNDRDSLAQRSYQLALRIAEVFDQYMVYKPEMLCQNNDNKTKSWPQNNQWQKNLWQQLCQWQGEKITSPADKIIDFFRLADAEMPVGLPPQTVFGVSIMSPVFLNFFKKLSATTEVHFFYLNPCDEFWADQKPSWAMQSPLNEPDDLDQHFENTLLGDFGQQGRKFFQAILELDDHIDERDWSPFSNNDNDSQGANAEEPSTLLRRIQQSVRTRTTPEDKFALSSSDDSLTIHSCHHELRQVEVLHDHLLALLQTGKYQLNDILVMAPDISRFATTIQAVFDQGPLRRSYAISDRSIKNTNLLAEAFLSILEISNSRYELSKIQRLLEVSALRRRFHFRDQDEATLNHWFDECRVRWGLDEQDRKKNLDFAFEQFSWQHALDRLLLGLALEEDDHLGSKPPLANIRPLNYADSTENMALLGNFCDFIKALKNFAEDSREPRPIEQWRQMLDSLLHDFFLLDNTSALDYILMQRTIDELCTAVSLGEHSLAPIPISVLKSALGGALESVAPHSPFLSGKITFCSMIPMRCIPGQVIALLGVDEDVFPRAASHLGFNLIAEELETTFRSRQLEDRYLFLEAILSAQDKLLIYYRGQDEHLQREYLPSVVITELLDFAQKITSHCKTHEALVVKHRLQGFDPHYFQQPQLLPEGFLRSPFSYHQPYANAALAIAAPMAMNTLSEEEMRMAYLKPLTDIKLETDSLTVTLDELERFFINPSQEFLVSQMNFPPPEWNKEFFSDFEPFGLNRLEEVAAVRTLAKELNSLEKFPKVDDQQIVSMWENFSQRNLLPIGALGKQTFQLMLISAWIENQALRQQWSSQIEHKFSVTCNDLHSTLDTLQQEVGDFYNYAVALRELPPDLQSEPPLSPSSHIFHQSFSDFLSSAKVSLPSSLSVTINGHVTASEDASSRIDFSFSSLTGRHRIRFYLRHLLLCAAGHGQNGANLYDDKNNVLNLAPIPKDEAAENLQKLLACYLIGKKIPLPIFENYSLELATAKNKVDKSCFYENFNKRGDASDFYVQHLWGQDVEKLPVQALLFGKYCYPHLQRPEKTSTAPTK